MAEQIVIDGRFAEIDVFAAIARGDRLSLSGFPSGVVHTDTFSGHKGRLGQIAPTLVDAPRGPNVDGNA